MNDFDYEVMQKKRTAASARRKTNGSKSRRCKLPSDHLTPAEIKKRSGPCMTYKLNAPMDWKTFKAMPVDLQQQYINGLQSRFGVSLGAISVDMFGNSNQTLVMYLNRNNIAVHGTGKRLSAAERESWEAFLNGCDRQAPQEEQPATVCAPPKDTVAQMFTMAAFAVEWVGEFTATEFIEQLTRLPIPDGRVRIKVEVQRI